ncbi:hypothetical protein [Paractinoplanes lichenicola]|uniref:Uncharacterized protein n=1 Tax=Paractinoplanes lichenicola TaxID=2802976 RepID=A0ABS1VST5_9ACTN|nr:hypothetical protein [Actinoplanes lichenicola]MBL7257534.1 hypothetical protein [Actinoplanes lichenicola]
MDAVRQAVLRRYARPVYQAGAVVALVATAQAVIVPAIGGPTWLWAAVPVAAGLAAVLTIKSIPYEHVKFPR